MVQCPRGTRDFLPDELEKRRAYEGTLRNVARRFGFREIQTPIFEDAELFILRSGPNVLKELYAFKDKGDRDLALRPEMTAAVVRAFVNGMSNDPKPIKVFYFGQCFRYERPQAGRYREFFQFGAEIMGAATPETDAEAIAMASFMIKSLGLRNYKLRIGHIGVLRQRIADIGVPKERTAEVLQKLDKKLYDEARPLLADMGVSEADMEDLFKLTETVGGTEVLSMVPGEAGDYLREVVDYLDHMGVKDVEIDLGVVRGLDYYTGMVFEAEAPVLGAEKQICGGGSYTLSELGEGVLHRIRRGIRQDPARHGEGGNRVPEGGHRCLCRRCFRRCQEGFLHRRLHAPRERHLRRHRYHGKEARKGHEVRIHGMCQICGHRGSERAFEEGRHPQEHGDRGAGRSSSRRPREDHQRMIPAR